MRTVTTFTTSLARDVGVEPRAVFAAFMDLEPFLAPAAPLPGSPSAIFIGVLERYKDVDGLAAACRLAAPRLPQTILRIVGDGSRAHVIERLVGDLPGQTVWAPRLTTPEVVQALDDSTFLVLPSRSEGMGRVIVEALCRGRPVIGTRVGGTPDLVPTASTGSSSSHRTRRHSPTRSCACSRTGSSRSGSPPPPDPAPSPGSQRRSNTRSASATWLRPGHHA